MAEQVDVVRGQEFKKGLTQNEVLDYIASFGTDITTYAKEAKAMLEIAEARGNGVDKEALEKALAEFRPLGSSEEQLVRLRSQVLRLKQLFV